MAVQVQPPRYQVEEYLALERAADYKSEYLDGQIYAMSGGSPSHSWIAANVTGLLMAHLSETPCRVSNSDLMVCTSSNGMFAYPDVAVVCSEPTFHDTHRDVLTNPMLIVEVLSPSTEAFDRGRKFAMYQQIESLTDYLLISQDQARVEHYARKSRNHWLLTIAQGLEGEIRITSLDCALRLSQVYAKVPLPAAE